MKQKKRTNTHSRPVPRLVAWLMFPLVAVMLLFAPGNAAAQIWSPTWVYSNFEEAVQVTDNSTDINSEWSLNTYSNDNTFVYTAENYSGSSSLEVNVNYVFQNNALTDVSAGNYALKFDLSTYVTNFNDAKLTFTLISENLSTPIATLGEFSFTEGSYDGSQKVEFQLEKELSGSAYMCMTFSGILNDNNYSCTFANFQMYEDRDFYITPSSNINGGTIYEQNGNGTAKGGDEVTISITPDNDNGYYFNSIKVTDSNGNPVAVCCDGFSAEPTTATFTMPYSDVTITPVFATDVTVENGAFVTIPRGEEKDDYGYIYSELETRTINLNENIKSFYVYDDGGKYDDYSDYCNGAIEITAPDGKLIRVTGTSEFANNYCNLDIFDGLSNVYPSIYTSVVSDGEINGLSSGNKMMIVFQSTSDNYYHQSGLSLKVDILNNEAHNITVDEVTGGTATCNNDNNQAKFKDDVTIQVEPAEGYYFGGIIVKEQGSEKPIIVSNIDWTQNTATFAMPYADVTVTPIFVNGLSSESGLSFNMPASSAVIPMFTLSEDVQSFKIYDDGGKDGNYSANSYGSIDIYAPKGKLIQVSGSINSTPDKGILRIYDKIFNVNGQTLLYSGSGVELIAPIISSDNTMELYFEASSDKEPGTGLDLTVALIDNVAHNITVNEAPNGSISVEEGKTSAKKGDVINLAAVPAEGYYLMNIEVKDADNNTIAVANGDFFTNDASFEMPLADVTITATFATEISAENGASICMPTSDGREIALPETVKSFHLYDDGGKDGNYSSGCTSTLTLTAPEGKLIQITGATAINKNDYLYVYCGDENGECLYSNYGTPDEINVISKKLQVRLSSKSNNPNSGIDWIVSVVENKAHNIKVKSEPAGTVTVDGSQTTATQNEVIKLTTTLADGYYLAGIEVADEDGNPISVTGGVWYDSDASFTMPYSDVTITPKFVSEITANGDYYINMPSDGNIELDLTNKPGVKSFRLFDDGGKYDAYSGQCKGTLTIKIPKGASIEISGTMEASYQTQLTIGDDYSQSGYYSSAEVNYSSDNNTTTINFYTDDDSPWCKGLDLTVTIVRKHSITLVQPEIGGTAFCELEDPTAVAEGEHVTIRAKTQNGYYLVGLNVIDENGGKIYVNNVDWNYSKATFAMPAASVTVTPIFSQEVTTDYGASITMVSDAYDRTIDLSDKPGVKSFYIYNDGGYESEEITSSLTIKAPEGKLIKITGKMEKDQSINATLTIGKKSYPDNVYYISTDNEATIYFASSWDENYGIAWLGLEVVIDPIMTLSDNGATATFHGSSTETLDIQDEITVGKVVYDRKFTAGKPSTVMLPFNYTCDGNEGGKFYQFAGVIQKDGIWTAVMEEAGDMENSVTTLEANKPYIFRPDASNTEGEMYFSNTPQEGFKMSTTVDDGSRVGDWLFHGTYSAMKWSADNVGKAYGFAAKAGTGTDENGGEVEVAQGQFVKLEAGASCKPMRAYLEYAPEGISKAGEELPSSINVVFIDRTAAVVENPDDVNGNDDPDDDISTPISEIAPGNNAVRVWSYDKTIFVEGNVGSEYRVIDLSGRVLVQDVLRTTRDEISLGARATGIVVVIINGKTYKLSY